MRYWRYLGYWRYWEVLEVLGGTGGTGSTIGTGGTWGAGSAEGTGSYGGTEIRGLPLLCVFVFCQFLPLVAASRAPRTSFRRGRARLYFFQRDHLRAGDTYLQTESTKTHVHTSCASQRVFCCVLVYFFRGGSRGGVGVRAWDRAITPRETNSCDIITPTCPKGALIYSDLKRNLGCHWRRSG